MKTQENNLKRIGNLIKTEPNADFRILIDDMNSIQSLTEEDKQVVRDYFNILKHFDIKSKNQTLTFCGESCTIDDTEEFTIVRIPNKLTGDVNISVTGYENYVERPFEHWKKQFENINN